MGDLARQIEESREHVAPRWTKERERQVQTRVMRGMRASRRQRLAAGAVMALSLAAVVLLLWGRPHAPVEVATIAEVAPQPLLHLTDGSAVTGLSSDARVEPVEVGAKATMVRLTAGEARFSVTPNPERTFRVRARDVTVTVLGTVFTVAAERTLVRVTVERGRVQVNWPGGERVLGVGEQAAIADAPAPLIPVPEPPSEPSAAGAEPEPGTPEAALAAPDAARQPDTTHPGERGALSAQQAPPAAAPRSWRALAESGDYSRAFERMNREGASAVHDEPGDLLLAADVARLGGHPETAVRHLSWVVSAHQSDSRAPLAAFTLGRTLLDLLGRPREAAQAFASARRLAPKGALAEDALAREVESWSRAGDASSARERAETYLHRYPTGRRLAAVRRFGGLD